MRSRKFALAALAATPIMLTQILGSSAFALTDATTSIEIDKDDLSTRRGVKKTYNRIAKAAENACTHSGRKGLREKVEAQTCTEELIDQMVAQADSPQLSAYLKNKKTYELASSE